VDRQTGIAVSSKLKGKAGLKIVEWEEELIAESCKEKQD
jgi:hypothetical protein